MISMNNLARLHGSIRDELLASMELVIDSGEFILGKEVLAFEVAAADYLGIAYAVGVSSGTAALELALRAADVHGAIVLTTSFSFIATATAVLAAGGVPVFVDVDPTTLQMNVPRALELADLLHPKVILPVHLYGQGLDISPLCHWADRNGAFVIDDAAQSFGAICGNEYVGTSGTIGCFSFFPTKNLGGLGDGGMVVTNHPEIAAKVRSLREPLYKDCAHPGAVNARLDALQAAVLSVKLGHLDRWNAARIEIFGRYNSAFCGLKGISCPPLRTGDVAHQYTIRTFYRNDLVKHLHANGVDSRVYYSRTLPQYLGLYDVALQYPESLRAAEEVISLPIHPMLQPDEQQQVIDAVRRFCIERA